MQADEIKKLFSELEKNTQKLGTDLKKLKLHNVPVWQFLRNLIYSDAQNLQTKRKQPIKTGLKKLLNLKSWDFNTKKTDYILFTDSNELIEMEKGIYIDKIAQNLIDVLNKKLLIVVNSLSGFNGKIKNNQNNLDSSYFHRKRRFENLNFEKEDEFDKNFFQIISTTNWAALGVDFIKRELYTNEIQWFFIYHTIFDQWLEKIKPKVVFVNCGYSLFHQSLIYTCNIKNIKTVELQHGLISDGHIQYSPSENIGKETFPQYLLTFSEYHSRFVNSNFIDSSNIYPIGHYYREQKIKRKNLACEKMVLDLRKKYKKIVLVSSQNIIEKELINTVNKIAKKRPEHFFIFKSRNGSDINFNSANIVVNNQYTIYDIMPFIDVNLSCFSTNILETLSSQTIAILMDFNNLASVYFNTIKRDCNNIFIVQNSTEAITILDRPLENYKNPVFYKDNNKKNVKDFLKQIS